MGHSIEFEGTVTNANVVARESSRVEAGISYTKAPTKST